MSKNGVFDLEIDTKKAWELGDGLGRLGNGEEKSQIANSDSDCPNDEFVTE